MLTSKTFHDEAVAVPPVFPEAVNPTGLAADERRRLASEVQDALAARLLPSARHAELIQNLAESFASSQRERADSRTILAVSGPWGVGKTGALLDWARRVHLDAVMTEETPQTNRECQPGRYRHDGGRADHIPLIWAGLRGSQKDSGVYRKILGFVRHGDKGTVDQLEIAVGEALEDHRPRLLVIDDAHMLRTHQAEGRKTLDSIKGLNDMVSHVGGTMLFIGADLIDGDLLNDPQIAARLERPHELKPYAVGTKPEIAEWQRLIKACEVVVQPYLDTDKLLMPHARLLWQLSQGRVRDLTRLLTQGTGSAIRAGRSSYIEEDFTRVRLLKHVDDQQQRASRLAAANATRTRRAS